VTPPEERSSELAGLFAGEPVAIISAQADSRIRTG
jgi:hypothetical protein